MIFSFSVALRQLSVRVSYRGEAIKKLYLYF